MKHFNFKFLLITILCLTASCTYYIGPNKWARKFSSQEKVISFNNNVLSKSEQINNLNLFAKEIEHYAQLNSIVWSGKFMDTIINPRVVYAKLLSRKDIFEVNAEIVKFKAWGTTGTSGKLNPKGDYDFSEIQWANIIWYFEDEPEILFPQTAKYIVDNLIIDNGNIPELKAPNTLGFLRETENHILMKETSRYLKNQWLYKKEKNAKFNNTKNGMEEFMLKHLKELLKTGFYEFNANPYISYTFEALHVLYNHAESEEIKSLCKQIIDAENYQYALGSFQLKKYSPFRRRLSRESIKDLNGDRHSILMKVELSKFHNEYKDEYKLNCCFDRTLILLTSQYVLPKVIVDLIENKTESYYAKIGHGIKSSPEIYYGTADFLLSAGGLRFGKRSQIVPRPITLFLNDEAKTVDDCFHIKGQGSLNQWNNTGVYKNFAVANHNVSIPNNYELFSDFGNWEIYKPYQNKDLFVCVFNQVDLGIIYITQNKKFLEILSVNNNEELLKTKFILENEEELTYNLNNSKKWIIETINDSKQELKFGKWKRFELEQIN